MGNSNRDKIIQIVAGIDGEMPGGIGHSLYGLSETGVLYILDTIKHEPTWMPYLKSPYNEQNREVVI